MGEIRLDVTPGVNTELTETANRGGWSASNLIRFVHGRPEKLGGWQKVSETPMVGACRQMHWWSDLDGLAWLAAGTNEKLYVTRGGILYDISPAGLPPGRLSSSPSTTPFALRVWSLDNFGQNLIGVPSGHGLYAWIPPNTGVHATLVSEAPDFNQGVFVAMPERIAVAYGSAADLATQQDPLLIRWSDQSDYTEWTVSTTNQAGSFRLPRGSRIVGALQIPLTGLIFTDLDVWSMRYIGFPLIFSISQVASNCGLIAQGAAVILGSIPYWMSGHGFYRMGSGGAEQIPCAVWDIVFRDLDTQNQDKCIAASDYHFGEIFFFYPSASGGTGEIDSYVKFNIAENLWDYGKLARTGWTDDNKPGDGAPGTPFGADLNGFIQQHDLGNDADGEPMTGVFIRSAYVDMKDGAAEMVANRLIPDFKWEGDNPSVTVKVLFRNFPGDAPTIAGPFTITPETNFVSVGTLTPIPVLGVRGREVAIEINSNAPGSWWRYGTPRLRTAPDGSL